MSYFGTVEQVTQANEIIWQIGGPLVVLATGGTVGDKWSRVEIVEDDEGNEIGARIPDVRSLQGRFFAGRNFPQGVETQVRLENGSTPTVSQLIAQIEGVVFNATGLVPE